MSQCSNCSVAREHYNDTLRHVRGSNDVVCGTMVGNCFLVEARQYVPFVLTVPNHISPQAVLRASKLQQVLYTYITASLLTKLRRICLPSLSPVRCVLQVLVYTSLSLALYMADHRATRLAMRTRLSMRTSMLRKVYLCVSMSNIIGRACIQVWSGYEVCSLLILC
jgi:hypothetical protein